MLVRRLSVFSCVAVALGLLLGASSPAFAAHGPHRGQRLPLPCPGESNLIVAIGAINRAQQFPTTSDVQLRVAEFQIQRALRIEECLHVQRDLNAALQMINAYRYRHDPAALQLALERTECALNELREHCLAEQVVYRPVLPPQPPVVYSPVYPVPYQNRSLTISKGAFSISIPLNR